MRVLLTLALLNPYLRPSTRATGTKRLTSLLVIALLMFIALGFAWGSGSKGNFLHSTGPLGASDWMLALVPVMFTYSGWNAATYVSEELRDPRRNVPRTLLIGTGVVTILYLLLNALYLFALAPEQLSGQIHVGDRVARALFGSHMEDAVTVLILLSLAGGLSAWIITGPRTTMPWHRMAYSSDPPHGSIPGSELPPSRFSFQHSGVEFLCFAGSLSNS